MDSLEQLDAMVIDDNNMMTTTTTTTTSDRWLETASELYDQVVFNTDAIFNQPAPEYWVSFIIGGVRIRMFTMRMDTSFPFLGSRCKTPKRRPNIEDSK